MNISPIPGFSEPISSLSHLLSAGIVLVAMVPLLRKARGNTQRMISLSIFSVCAIFLFSMSGVYHLLDPLFFPRQVLKRLDHAAIWVMIAGTFTPIHCIIFRGLWRWGMIALIWVLAITGLTLEVIFLDSIPEWVSLCFYLGMGYLGILSGWGFHKKIGDPSIKYLYLGGIMYTLGAVMDFFRWPILIENVFGPHEIFHVFVIAGAGFHWWLIYLWADHPTKSKISFNLIERSPQEFKVQAVGENISFTSTSKEQALAQIKQEVKSSFHDNLQPEEICVKYSAEEIL